MTELPPNAAVADAPYNISICAATFKRPEGLRALLESLNAMSVDAVEVNVSILIVENCPENPASETLGDVSSLSIWPLTYIIEQERGIVAARNRALDEVPTDADFVAFLDDDETVSEGWLKAMVETAVRTNADAVQGPVLPDYEAPPKDWIEASGVFRLGPFARDEVLSFASTNNVLIACRYLHQQNPRFDPRFNTTGGEDEEFFFRLRRAGGTIRAASQAIVHDQVPRNRLTLKWALRRKFRMGNTLGRIAMIHKDKIILRFLKGIGASLKGIGTCLVLGLGSKNRFIGGTLEAARGLGMISAFFGVAFKEYSVSAVSKDRREPTS